ncbi:MAG: DapH/DapD/GlmU-related protein [Candidatus Nanohalobium sp.]
MDSNRHEISINGTRSDKTRPIEIGDNVWIGARAIILPGVEVSNHGIIGAGSVVAHDVEEF